MYTDYEEHRAEAERSYARWGRHCLNWAIKDWKESGMREALAAFPDEPERPNPRNPQRNAYAFLDSFRWWERKPSKAELRHLIDAASERRELLIGSDISDDNLDFTLNVFEGELDPDEPDRGWKVREAKRINKFVPPGDKSKLMEAEEKLLVWIGQETQTHADTQGYVGMKPYTLESGLTEDQIGVIADRLASRDLIDRTPLMLPVGHTPPYRLLCKPTVKGWAKINIVLQHSPLPFIVAFGRKRK